jgi:hypothetical protein
VLCCAGLNGSTIGPDWAKLNGMCLPNGLLARPKHGPAHATGWPRPINCLSGQIMGQPIYHGPNFQRLDACVILDAGGFVGSSPEKKNAQSGYTRAWRFPDIRAHADVMLPDLCVSMRHAARDLGRGLVDIGSAGQGLELNTAIQSLLRFSHA